MIKNPDCKNKTWSVAVLDDMILSEIKKLTLEDIKKRDSVDADILKKELAKIESQIKRYLQLYGTGRYDLDTLDGLVLPLEQKKMSIEDELKRIPEEEDIDLPTLQEAVDISSFDDKRQIVESLIQKIVIDGDDITIFWKFK